MGDTMASLYRGYDRAGLDAQLNLRARWPEHPGYFARWERDSAVVRANHPCRCDLSYGPTGGQALDVFFAQGQGGSAAGAPLVAFIHGGYWQSLDKGDFSYLAPTFTAAGIAFASLNYDLAPEVSIEAIVGQIRAALAWLHDRADEFDVDPARLYAAGHSAGGHLAVMAMTTDWPALGKPADLVKGACSVSGVYDLEPVRLSYHQDIVALDPGMVARMSPIRRIPAAAPPLICAVGGEETEEFLHQQAAFAEAWRAGGHDVTIVDLPGRNHFTAVDALGEPAHGLFAAFRALTQGSA